MFKLLVDTCVWLDLAKDSTQGAVLLTAVEQLIERSAVALIVPRIVVDEFACHQDRIGKESSQSLRGVLRRVKDAVEQFGDPGSKKLILQYLDDVNQRMPIKGGVAVETLKRIERLFAKSSKIEASDAVLLRASRRAIESKAPFHRNSNSMGDAVIIETYSEALRAKEKGVRFAFVTHNTKDFSAPADDARKPHPDLQPLFSPIKSLYFTKLADALRRVDASLVDDVTFEHSFEQESRGLTEILEAMDLLLDQVWYNRHKGREAQIADGQLKLIDEEPTGVSRNDRPIERVVWQRALASAAKVERRHGLANLGPWTDFEWGMINGKLSALRWVLGDEWDMLDT